MSRVPSRGSDQFVVRFPEGMRDRIKDEADKNGRSMNAEIIARLNSSFWALEEIEASKEKNEQLLDKINRLMNDKLSEIDRFFDDQRTSFLEVVRESDEGANEYARLLLEAAKQKYPDANLDEIPKRDIATRLSKSLSKTSNPPTQK